MNLLATIEKDFEAFKAGIKLVESEMYNFLKPFVEELFSDAGQIVVKTVEGVTAQVIANPSLITQGGNGLKDVETMALNSLKSQGIEAGTHILTAALSAADTTLKAAIQTQSGPDVASGTAGAGN